MTIDFALQDQGGGYDTPIGADIIEWGHRSITVKPSIGRIARLFANRRAEHHGRAPTSYSTRTPARLRRTG
jgi:hypothetical protein